MKIRILLLVVALFLSPLLYAAEVTVKQRVPNRGDGYCGWCCLEMVGLHHGYSSLKGLTDKREQSFVWNDYTKRHVQISGAATINDLIGELKEHKIDYKAQWPGTYDKTIIKQAIAEGNPVIFATLGYPSTGARHAMLLTDFSDKGVKFIDPNDHKSVYKAGFDWFDKHWTGYALVVQPSKHHMYATGTRTIKVDNAGFIYVNSADAKGGHVFKPEVRGVR